MICQYCSSAPELVSAVEIYSSTRPEFIDRKFWLCRTCGAYVGCHPGTDRPMGTLANQELRKLRMAAHQVFDALWRDGRMKRKTAYAWLAYRMGRREIHIGSSDEKTCREIIEACGSVAFERF